MDFIAFSDLHLNKFPYANITKDGENELLMAGLNIIDQVYAKAVEYGVKFIFFCGDMFHIRTKLDSDIYSNLVYKKLKQYFGPKTPINLILIPGNHDQIDKTGTHVLAPFSEIYNVTVVDKLYKRGNIVICPHQYDIDKLYAFLEKNSTEQDIIFMHQLIFNSPVMSGAIFRKNEAVDISRFKYKLLFSGHNHRPFVNKSSDAHNIGSPMHYDFGDAECPERFMIHCSKEGKVTWIPTNFPHFAMAGTENVKEAKYVKKQNKKVVELASRIKVEWTDKTKDVLGAYIESAKPVINPDLLLREGLNLLNPTA
jgi:DNA repair exonuclease SbcCD nuclease subunit